MAASIFLFNNWRKAAQSGANLNGATLKATLHTSSYTPNVASQAVYADLTNELSTANGYANGGERRLHGHGRLSIQRHAHSGRRG